MATTLGVLRRRLLAPTLDEVGFAGRGFPVTPTAATARMEAVPQSVVCGLEWGLEVTDLGELERRLAMIEPELRGFAYEGATMASVILDAMRPKRSHRTRELLLGPGRPHLFLTYIGIGFAMARLPRPLWRTVLPDLTGAPYHPTMSWLAVDGYGFDRAYFETRRWVDEQRVPSPYPWLDAPDYFLRAFDQGVGRALWFIHGGQPDNVAAAVTRFADGRQADLWSGVGLAATFAGGCDTDGLTALRRAAGDRAPELAVGAVFAAKARSYAGFVPPHTGTGTEALAGLSVPAAVALADDTAVPPVTGTPEPAYELWRRNIAGRVAVAPATR
jgi:hypothetical protein